MKKQMFIVLLAVAIMPLVSQAESKYEGFEVVYEECFRLKAMSPVLKDLVSAIDKDDLNTVAYCLKEGADINAMMYLRKNISEDCGSYIQTNLIGYAVIKKHWNIVKYLAEYGADITSSEEEPFCFLYSPHSLESILEAAADDNNLEMFQYFLTNYNMTKSAKLALLYGLLEWHFNLECIKALIDFGTPVNVVNFIELAKEDDLLEPIMYAAFQQSIEACQILVSAGADIDLAIKKAEALIKADKDRGFSSDDTQEAVDFLKNFINTSK